MELEARNPTNGAWYHCIVSISSNGSPNAALRVQPVSQGTEKVCFIHDKGAVFGQLRGRSEPLSNGTCLQVEDGHKVLLKPESGVQRFFEAEVQKVRRLRHAPTAECKCTFELRWTNAGNQARTATVKAHVVRRLTGVSVQGHHVVGEWLKSKGSSYLGDTGDLEINLRQHLEQISSLPGSANKAQKQQAAPATPEKKQESFSNFEETSCQFDDALPEKKPSRLRPLAARAALAASLNQADRLQGTSKAESDHRDRNKVSHVVPAGSSTVASQSQSKQLVEDGTVSVMGDGNHGHCSIMDTEDRNYLEQMEAHLRLLNTDVELNLFDSKLFSRNTGETGQMPCGTNSHWKMVDGEASSDLNSDEEPLDQGSHALPSEKLTESPQEECQMAVAPSLSLRRELARARQLKSRVKALSQADKQPRRSPRQAAGTSVVQEPSMKTPIEEREASAGHPSRDNSAVHLEPLGKQPRRSPRLAAGTGDVQEASSRAQARKVSAGETSENQTVPLSGKQPRKSSRIAADDMKNRTSINEREAFAGESLQDQTPVLALVPGAAETDGAFLKPSGMRVTPIQEREPSQDLSVEPMGLHVDLTADSLEPSTKLPEEGISVPLNGREPAEPLEKEATQVSKEVDSSTETRALKTNRKREVPIDEAQGNPPKTRVKTQPALKGKRKCIHEPPGANQVEDSAERKVETRSASTTRVPIDEYHQVENSVEVKVKASVEPKVRKRKREVPTEKALKSIAEAKVEVIRGSIIKRKRGVPIHELDGICVEDVPVAACKPAAEPVLKSLRKSPRNGGFSLEAKRKAKEAEASEPEVADITFVERRQTRRSSGFSAASSEDLGASSINKKHNRVPKETVKLNADSVVVKASKSEDVATPKSGTMKKNSSLDKKNGSVGLPRRSPRFVIA